MNLEDNLKLSLLTEIYKNLLTAKQQSMLSDFLDKNLSISELALEYNSSRQAVNDLLKRTFKTLEDYENKLHLLEKFEKVKRTTSQIISIVDAKGEFGAEMVKEKLNAILEVL